VLPLLATVLSGAAAAASCVTAPPPDLPVAPAQGPIIVQDAVQPPPSEYLLELPPQGFVVPVKVTDPTKPFVCRVFVDFYPGSDNTLHATGTALTIPATPALDGGVTLVTFSLTTTNLGDPTACHTIQAMCADEFDQTSGHTPGDSLGSDGVVWQYAPNTPGGCSTVDGGDGEFPDAPLDGLPLTPDSIGPL
jgi:hypothetical protein